MARTLSGCLNSIAMRVGDAWCGLQAKIDRIFLAFATLAHLCISILGTATLLGRATQEGQTGAGLADASTLLFLLAGAITAMLLLHASRSQMPAPQADAYDRRGRTPFAEAAAGARTAGREPAASGFTPLFSGLMDTVGHEIRTPLNAIIGFSDLMQRELLGPLGSPRYREYVRHIRESGLAVLKAAEETMALTALLAERAPVRHMAVDLDGLLADVCRQSQTNGRAIRLARSAAHGARVCAEPRALRQSLGSLVSAAAVRSAANRPIAITTNAAGASMRLCVSFTDARSTAPRPGGAEPRRGQEATHASMAVAKMLFELQGVRLVEMRGADGTRRMVADLPLAEAPRRRAGTRTPLGARIENGALLAQ